MFKKLSIMATCLRDMSCPVVKEFRMNKLVKFLVALTDPELIGAIGVVVGLIVACMFGGH